MSEQVAELEPLLEYLKESRGFDFTGYKRTSLSRRILKRMEMVGASTVPEYIDRLQVDPDEFTELFNFILINLTSFFRDPLIWDFVGDEIVPRILEVRGDSEPIRVWVPGCASGEEPYSVAMVLAERLGVDAFRSRVKIYATDVDEEALAQARAAQYTARQVDGVPPQFLTTYFERVSDDMFVVRKELRPAVIFGRHDLVQDAPISRIDLLMCRNTLMYLNSETQSRVMEHFYFALAEGGFLVLGKAEMLFTQLKSFLPVDLKRRVFVKNTVDDEARERLLLMSNAGREEGGSISNHVRGRESAFEHGPVAQIVLDRNGIVVQANERARRLFNISVQDVGRPLQDLDLSFRPVELRSHLKVLQKDRKSVRVRDVRWQLEGNSIWLEIELVALEDTGGRLLGTSIAFHEVTRYRELQEELDQSNQELETAIEELQSTNEELETTNEELQSTNEELETMNEELHSTNDELQTINDEARRRSEELNRANAFLGGILGSVNAAVVVLDQDLRVLLWNDRSRDLWGLTADEVAGQPFLHLDIGLPVERLRDSLLGGANGDGQDPIDLEAVNRRGQRILCRVRFSPMRDTHGVQSGMILTMEDAPPDGG